MNRCRLSFLLNFLNSRGLKPNRSLSQNFLIDANIVNKIVSQLKIEGQDNIIEIGPGAGALTEKLCEFPINLICVEKDKNLSQHLNFESHNCQSYEVINQDVMLYDIPRLDDQKLWKVISNLPYHITSKIIKKLSRIRERLNFCVVMVEKGYAEDLMNAEIKKQHDATSFILHHAFEIQILFPVSKACFFPKPKIDSAVIMLKPKKVLENDADFLDFIEIFFHQKRKMVQSILKTLFEIDVTNLDPSIEPFMKLRPEDLTEENAFKIFLIFYDQIKKKIEAKKEKNKH